MPILLAAFAGSFVAGLMIERLRQGLPSTAGLFVRLGIHAALFGLIMAIALRPWLAATLVVVLAAVLTLVSEIKRGILAEPLTLTDFALVPQAVRHPALYYVDVLQRRPMQILVLFIGLGLIAVLGVWIIREPPLIAIGALADRALWAASFFGALAIFLHPAFSRFACTLLSPHLFGEDEARHGLLASLALTAAARHAQPGALPIARKAARALPRPLAAPAGPSIVVVVQMESFVDIAKRDASGPEFPHFTKLRQEAVLHGSLLLPYEGAYTMRTEFGFLSALPGEMLGMHVSDPFLSARHYGVGAVPQRMREAGYRTVFIHPYDGDFFARRSVMPALGFDAQIFEDAFSGARRDGPYVSDAAVAERILAEACSSAQPAFIFAVTVEAHGPWRADRLPDISDPAMQYRHHLRNADRMIATLRDALAQVPGGAVLCVYGDHAPARSLALEIGDRRMTDFAIWDSRSAGAAPPAERSALPIHDVAAALLRHLAGETKNGAP